MKRIYLDNCCYNRPFDDQTQIRIQLETLAKLQIQRDVRADKYELVWSYVLDYENSMNPFEEKKQAIEPWRNIAKINVSENKRIIEKAEELEKEGLKAFDALHIAAALSAKCEYFLTTDKKLINHEVKGICVMNPITFIAEQED